MAWRTKLEPVSLPKAATGDNITSMSFFALMKVRRAAIAMLCSIAAASAGAQDSARVVTAPDSLASRYRDPHTAQTLGSFLPGAGHIYAGESLRGLGFAGAALIGIAAGITFLTDRQCYYVALDSSYCRSNVSTSNRINGITELATGVAAWVFGAIDAPRAARRVNAAHQRVSVAPFARDDGVRHAALGVAVTVGW